VTGRPLPPPFSPPSRKRRIRVVCLCNGLSWSNASSYVSPSFPPPPFPSSLPKETEAVTSRPFFPFQSRGNPLASRILRNGVDTPFSFFFPFFLSSSPIPPMEVSGYELAGVKCALSFDDGDRLFPLPDGTEIAIRRSTILPPFFLPFFPGFVTQHT